MLLINNQEVAKLFDMKAYLEALEDGYDDLFKGDAVSDRNSLSRFSH